MKKIAIGALVVIFAIAAFFYVQTDKLERAVTAKLAQHETTFGRFNVGFLPQPYIAFEQVRHNQIRIEKLTGKFPLTALLFGDVKLEQVEIRGARFSDNARNAADIQMRFADFSLDNITADGIVFNGDNAITVELENPLYGKNKTFDFRFVKGEIRRTDDKKFIAALQRAALNQQPLGTIHAAFDLSGYVKLVTADIQSDCPQRCFAQVRYQSEPEKSAVGFSGKNYPLESLLILLNFPNTVTGSADFDIKVQFAHSQITDGIFYFDARDGELLGLNLLDLAGQYLPINWSAEELKEKGALNTKYERITSRLSLNGHELNIEETLLKTTALSGRGEGKINLTDMQCDVNLTLRPANEKYRDIALPIQFFGSCYSPQYKLNLTKAFRNQLKELIKQKLK